MRPEVIFVPTSARSGSSATAGALVELGWRVPQPEIPPDPSNPYGFFEPGWLVSFHRKVLAAAGYTGPKTDARLPSAVGGMLERHALRPVMKRWLCTQLDACGSIVLKDPRLVWFLGHWCETARSLGVEASVVVPVRHPASVIRSKANAYGDHSSPTPRLREWTNVLLTIEESSRASPRAFVDVAYLANWREHAMAGIERDLGLTLPIGRRSRAPHRSGQGQMTMSTEWPSGIDMEWKVLATDIFGCLLSMSNGGAVRPARWDGLRARYARLEA